MCVCVDTAPTSCLCVARAYILPIRQDKLLTESLYCPVEGCRSQMRTRKHLGAWKKVCAKKKCAKMTSFLVSSFFRDKGRAVTLLHHISPCHIYRQCVCPGYIVHTYTTTLHRGTAKSMRVQCKIAHCFAWGTRLHHIHLCACYTIL